MSSPGQRRGKCGHVMANFGVIDEQGAVKSPAVVPPPDKKPKKDNKSSKKEKSPSTKTVLMRNLQKWIANGRSASVVWKL